MQFDELLQELGLKEQPVEEMEDDDDDDDVITIHHEFLFPTHTHMVSPNPWKKVLIIIVTQTKWDNLNAKT